jgi:hypothetical protein
MRAAYKCHHDTLCVRMYVRACVHACVRAYLHACLRACVRVCVFAFVRACTDPVMMAEQNINDKPTRKI